LTNNTIDGLNAEIPPDTPRLCYWSTGSDELFDKKDPETIKVFLVRYLNPDKRTFVVTDLFSSYPDVLHEFFGDKLIHQLCLLHLSKRIVNDFP